MPTKAEETVQKDVLYPDDLPGRTLEIDGERLNGETAFYHADDDAGELPDGARRGWWLPVDCSDDGETWAAMPRVLREGIAGHEPGEIFEVVSIGKGPGETDAYEAEIGWLTG